jgi:outer membrane protein TolC
MVPYHLRPLCRFGPVLLLLGFLISFLSTLAVARDLTLQQCVDLAVAHDPETQNAKNKIGIGKLKRSKAIQDFLPRLDVYATYGPQTDYFGRPVTNQNVYYTGVGLEQPLYKGGILTNGLKLAESETRREELVYHFRKLAVEAEAIKAYYQALSSQAVTQQYDALLRHGAEDLKEAESRLAGGQGTRLEVLELSVKLLETQQRLSKSKTDYQVNLSALKKLTGVEEETSLSLIGQYPLQDIRANLQNLLQEAQAQRPDLKAGQEDVTYNQLKTDIESGKRWPQLSLVARQEWENPTFFTGKKDWLVLLKASVSLGNTTLSYSEQRTELYPNPYAFPTAPGVPQQTFAFPVRQWKYSIFDRSSNKVELEEAKAAREFSRDRWDQLRRQAYYDVKDAFAQKTDSGARMVTAQKQIAMAQELLAITQTKYSVGLTTLAEVFKARASLAEAQVNLINAQNDQATALGQLYKALGRNMMFQGSGS